MRRSPGGRNRGPRFPCTQSQSLRVGLGSEVKDRIEVKTREKVLLYWSLVGLLLVTTPSSLMMLVLLNCPMTEASRKNSLFCCSLWPALSVFIATVMSILPGMCSRPRQTSPNSPVRVRQHEQGRD